jgi:hypothetical protein
VAGERNLDEAFGFIGIRGVIAGSGEVGVGELNFFFVAEEVVEGLVVVSVWRGGLDIAFAVFCIAVTVWCVLRFVVRAEHCVVAVARGFFGRGGGGRLGWCGRGEAVANGGEV